MPDFPLTQQFASLALNLPLMVEAYDSEGALIFWNKASEKISGYKASELLNNPKAMEILYPGYKKNRKLITWFNTKGHNLAGRTWKMTCKGGEERDITWFNISKVIVIPQWPSWGVGWDVTERLQLDDEIKKQQKEMEKQLQRTTEGRVALKVLLEQLEWEIQRARQDVSSQLASTVLPLLDKLFYTKLDLRQQEILNLAVKNLKNVQINQNAKPSNVLKSLTPIENEVALFVQEGKGTAEISTLMNVSVATINSHRHAIRRKLGLVGKGDNLQLALKKLFYASKKDK